MDGSRRVWPRHGGRIFGVVVGIPLLMGFVRPETAAAEHIDGFGSPVMTTFNHTRAANASVSDVLKVFTDELSRMPTASSTDNPAKPIADRDLLPKVLALLEVQES
ncbi:MAG TPA: hypothetical protein PKK01_08345 [Mycobacterium sp.]|nr:hypothetical protein [Mycobacterium sp.]